MCPRVPPPLDPGPHGPRGSRPASAAPTHAHTSSSLRPPGLPPSPPHRPACVPIACTRTPCNPPALWAPGAGTLPTNHPRQARGVCRAEPRGPQGHVCRCVWGTGRRAVSSRDVVGVVSSGVKGGAPNCLGGSECPGQSGQGAALLPTGGRGPATLVWGGGLRERPVTGRSQPCVQAAGLPGRQWATGRHLRPAGDTDAQACWSGSTWASGPRTWGRLGLRGPLRVLTQPHGALRHPHAQVLMHTQMVGRESEEVKRGTHGCGDPMAPVTGGAGVTIHHMDTGSRVGRGGQAVLLMSHVTARGWGPW